MTQMENLRLFRGEKPSYICATRIVIDVVTAVATFHLCYGKQLIRLLFISRKRLMYSVVILCWSLIMYKNKHESEPKEEGKPELRDPHITLSGFLEHANFNNIHVNVNVKVI